MTTFSDVLPITQSSSHQYTANFEDDWCIGTVPNGGYVTSAFMLVASNHMQLTHKRTQKHVINLHLEFMRRTRTGIATFTVKDLKIGSRISNLHITLAQSDPESKKLVAEVEGYITMTDMNAEEGLSLDTGFKLLPEPLPVSLPALTKDEDANYVLRVADPLADYRRAGRHMALHLVRPSIRPSNFPKAMIDQWVRFRPRNEHGKLTNDCLGFVVDLFPQIVEQYLNPELEAIALKKDTPAEEIKALKKKAAPRAKWYPTLLLNIDVKKALPEEGVEWLFVRVQASKIYNGRFDLLVRVLDDTGDLVAVSSHAALVLSASRNTTRKTKESKGKL